MLDEELQSKEGDMGRIFTVIYSDEDDDGDEPLSDSFDTPLSKEVDRLLDLLLNT